MTLLRKIIIQGVDENGDIKDVAVTVNNELEVRDAYSYDILRKIDELTDAVSKLMSLHDEGLVYEPIISALKDLIPAPMRYENITSILPTTCKVGNGFFSKIILNNPSNTRITIYDSITDSGRIIASIDPDASATPLELNYGVNFSNGLTVISGSVIDMTIIYK